MKNKEYKNFLFIPYEGFSGVKGDCSDGYLTEGLDGNRRIKLPHSNFTLLGIVDECINAPYAEEFSKTVVDKDECGWYYDYELGICHYEHASDSFQTLARVLNLKPTDYILRDDSNLLGVNSQTYKITQEQLKEAVGYIYNKQENFSERSLKGVRGCSTRGYVDLNDFSHCGNERCSSCNMVRQALEDEITRITFKPYDNER
jgi:hypothetical protein